MTGARPGVPPGGAGSRPPARPGLGRRLRDLVEARGPLCVGLDPHPELLERWGFADDPAGLAGFTGRALDALAGQVAVVKPQSAFYERFGSAGIAVLESNIRQLRAADTIILLDVKRGDIGSTVRGYAEAYLHPASPVGVDAITASPYLGLGSLEPMFAAAAAYHRGVFVLGLTSNPEGALVQRAVTSAGRTVAQTVIDGIALLNAGERPDGGIGLVLGATVGLAGHDLSRLGGPILVPGMGEQGGRPADLLALVGGYPGVVLPAFSRALLGAGPDPGDLRRRAAALQAECREALMRGAGRR